jgi:competence protein ComEC
LNIFVTYVLFQEKALNTDFLQVTYLDIGQGDSIFIQAPHGQTMLIDAGLPTSNALAGIGKLVPFYEKSIDVVMASHPDADHIGGLPNVIKNYKPGVFIESGVSARTEIDTALHDELRKQNIHTLFARRGMKILLDETNNVVIDILFPDRDVSTWTKNTNDASIVARLKYGNETFLFNGDSPIKIEEHLIQTLRKEALNIDVLKVGHHGSRTSTSDIFVKYIQPRIAIISAGKENRYKHPHNEVIEVLKKNNVEILRTDQQGTITYETDGKQHRTRNKK